MKCNEWIGRLSQLRSDTSAARWPATTLHRAPHKPLLLLSVLDLITQGEIRSNFFEYGPDLISVFEIYWEKLFPEKPANSVLPFFHMKRDGFWHLLPVPGKEDTLENVGQIRSVSQLQSLVVGARLEDSLFNVLQDDVCRDAIRHVLIEQYFAPEIHPILVETGQIVGETYQYSLQLYSQTRRSFRIKESETQATQFHQEARSAGFRRVVVGAYNHTCAFCEVRLVTPEGRTAVEAAHIIPWSESRNDDPRNGLALCGLHHWSFDNGMASVDSHYRITVSPYVYQQESATLIRDLEGKKILLPQSKELLPHPDAFKWHRKNRLRSDVPQLLV